MNLMDINTLTDGPVLNVITWLQRQNLIASPLRCVPCNKIRNVIGISKEKSRSRRWLCAVRLDSSNTKIFFLTIHFILLKYYY